MCRSHNSFCNCGRLVAGEFLVCKLYESSFGRECEGYRSFARRVCPSCSKCHQSDPKKSSTSQPSRTGSKRAATAVYDRRDAKIAKRSFQSRQTPAPRREPDLSAYPLLAAAIREAQTIASANAAPVASMGDRQVEATANPAPVAVMVPNRPISIAHPAPVAPMINARAQASSGSAPVAQMMPPQATARASSTSPSKVNAKREQ